MYIYGILVVVDNTKMVGTVSQIFDIDPSFYFMIINGNFCNCFIDIYSIFHKMTTRDTVLWL